MFKEKVISMSAKELKRYQVIMQAIDKRITQRHAATLLSISPRHSRRLIKQVRDLGAEGIVHRLRGKPSNRRHQAEVKKRVLRAYPDLYQGFGPTLLSEKLWEKERIRVNRETLRRWLLEADLWVRQRKGWQHRQWRERKACFGEMVQVDGSHHDWLENRGPKLVLMAYIDDATNEVFARFYDYEGTMPVMDSFYQYIKRYGLPHSLYMDRHAAYQGPSEGEVSEPNSSKGQFSRALRELGVERIHAYSPQAKGRVERLFRTFQDRLIKEMRLAGVKIKAEANRFLITYLPRHNRKFRKLPRCDRNLHHPAPGGIDLEQVLSIQTKRTLRNDNTIRHLNRLYQVLNPWNGKRPRQLLVEERINGKFYLTDHGRELRYREIQETPHSHKPFFTALLISRQPKQSKLKTPTPQKRTFLNC